ncbi:ADP-ribosylglycohydrolase family protein [uncultured Treponema sp.]|uniref:ADP-ribosylglycohydrolase family protein n=1 Tax=uncultured Treponema sp. TaxID=162155 RepID=UPI0025D2B49E|nr:ADP-ribosylglycohydrolase family protein [uncultured Treponema sp.]
MTGAIIGDIIGSRFEYHNIHTKKFLLFTPSCHITDDSILTMAVAKALVTSKEDFSDLSEKTVQALREFGRKRFAAYGKMFSEWLHSENPAPYNSFGNGAGMRVSPVGFLAKDLEECKRLSRIVTEVTHNHPEGLKGAEAIAVCVFLARIGKTKEEIRSYVNDNYYALNFTLEDLRSNYKWSSTCQDSVPQAIVCFLESESFTDAIRNAISIGGDSDTIAAMTGAIAEAFYGISQYLRWIAKWFCPRKMYRYVTMLEQKIPYMEISTNLTYSDDGKMITSARDFMNAMETMRNNNNITR